MVSENVVICSTQADLVARPSYGRVLKTNTEGM